MELYGKKIVIYGAGVSGLSAWQLVREHGGNAVIYDDNPQKAHATSSTRVFADCDMIVLSPGVPPSTPVVLDARLEGRQVISELELASSFCRAEQIAVTGTNGKTTTVIGAAFSAVADRLDAVETAVVEASSFQLETSSRFAPDIAVMLNITPDHLDRHGNMERYAGAKARIFLNQSESDFAVYNADDERVTSLLPVVRAKRVPFSATRPVDGAYISSGFLCFRGKPVVEVADTDFAGREVENALAALAVAAIKDINFHTVAAVLTSFRRPEFRRKECGKVDGVRIFNDSKATNVYSVISAAESMDGDCVLILGGAKGSEDFAALFGGLPSKVKGAVIVGENADYILAAAREAGFYGIRKCATLEEACVDAVELAKENDCDSVLFSPSSKSFDNYTSYSERGRAFDAAVVGLSRRK